MSLHPLSRHPDTPCPALERIEVALDRTEDGLLSLTYRLIGDANQIVAALPAGPPRRRDELWRRTCCELFVHDAAGSGYREYNFAPCGDWTAYRFSDYRAGRRSLDASPPRIALERSATAFELTATLTDQPFAALRAAPRIGIACVVETAAGLSYWALAHAPGRPDFHHARAFALTLAIEHTAHCTDDASG